MTSAETMESVRQRISGLTISSEYEHRHSLGREMGASLNFIVDSVEQWVLPIDPKAVLELLVVLFESDGVAMENCGEHDWEVACAYKRAAAAAKTFPRAQAEGRANGLFEGMTGIYSNCGRVMCVNTCTPRVSVGCWSTRMILRMGVVLALSGCAVGPNFKPPSPPVTDAYKSEVLPTQTEATGVVGGEAQRFQAGQDLPGQWWTLFGSTQLNALIDEAMGHYPDIAAQQAALRAARENVRAEVGVFFPQIQGAGSGSREKSSGAAIAPGFPGFITNIYQATVNVSYTFDIFGGERRAVEGLQAQALAQNFKLEASYLTLTSNVVSTAIQLASAREQIAVTNEIIALETKQLGFIQRQFDLGSHTRADVLQQQSNLASVRATLPPLQQQQAVAEHQLAVLTGHFPHDAVRAEFSLADLKLPQDLPVSLPSSLVAQRPDIKMQEMVMRQDSAAIGVATANMLPQLTLSSSFFGYESVNSASLFTPGANVWNLGAGITQPIFEGGALRAKRRAAIDTYDQATAQYQLTVLQAFQNVADTLTALDSDVEALKAEYDAVNAAKASLDLIQKQYDDGAADYVSLLTAEQSYQQARIACVRAIASRYTDTVTLFQALGGGWWNRNDSGTLQVASSHARSSATQN
jgi:NodT family efflux transporter outer membrane factor (OMF) lipoprotein